MFSDRSLFPRWWTEFCSLVVCIVIEEVNWILLKCKCLKVFVLLHIQVLVLVLDHEVLILVLVVHISPCTCAWHACECYSVTAGNLHETWSDVITIDSSSQHVTVEVIALHCRAATVPAAVFWWCADAALDVSVRLKWQTFDASRLYATDENEPELFLST